MKKRAIILASASPRRIDIMQKNGYDPIIIPPDIDETLPYPMEVEEAVIYLARRKARAVEEGLAPDLLSDAPVILAADTVVYDGKIIGKPKDKDDAFAILSSLSGKEHQVVTGVALLKAGMSRERTFYEVSRVFFKPYKDEELVTYVDTPEPYDKSGGYAVRGTFSKYVDHIEGDVDNITGLPWKRTEEELRKFMV